jgi:hypothetical protein
MNESLGLILRQLVGVILRGSRDSVLAAGLMHSVFNRTNNGNGISADLLDGELYRVAILIAVVVLPAALALAVGRDRLSRAYRLELDLNSEPTANRTESSSQQPADFQTDSASDRRSAER